MCIVCEREEAIKAQAEAARRAAEPKRELKLAEILRGDPCYTYSERARERFEELGSVMVSVSLAVDQAEDWDWYWAASRLLTAKGYEAYSERIDTNYRAYNDTLRPYRQLMDDAAAVAMVEYNRARDRVLKAGGTNLESFDAGDKVYEELTEVQRAALNTVREVLDKRQNEALAKAFAEVYISEEGTKELTGNDRYYGYGDDYDEDDDL